MQVDTFQFSFQVYESAADLDPQDAMLLLKAQEVSALAYAPYSHFYVGAAAKLQNGIIVTGTNQENASYPVGICAERVLLASASSVSPNTPVESIAISYRSDTISSDHPIAPCGICRQSLLEYEIRMKQPIKLILGGMEGKVYVIKEACMLLPFCFTQDDLYSSSSRSVSA
ncbi:MAG: cytidine deaminase [Chitinophagaceae bacterium]